jgi:hypothetical protein
MPGRAWKMTEVNSVIQQVNEGKKLPEIEIKGRTRNAINDLLTLLRKSKRLKDRPTRSTKKWTQESILRLKELVAQGNSASKIAKGNLLGENETVNAISQKMRRLGLGNPKVRELMKNAKQLPREKSKELNAFLRGLGKRVSTKRIASTWKINPATVTDRRRRLKVQQSWREARRESPRFTKMASTQPKA